jgi:hypothetical protein
VLPKILSREWSCMCLFAVFEESSAVQSV